MFLVMFEGSEDTPNVALSDEETINVEFQSMSVDEGDEVQHPENKVVHVKEICGDDKNNRNEKVDGLLQRVTLKFSPKHCVGASRGSGPHVIE